MSAWALSALLTGFSFAQAQVELGQFYVTDVPDSEYLPIVVREDALLVVHSPIPNHTFGTTNLIHETDDSAPGRYYVRIAPGTHVITYKAEGYQTVTGERFNIEERRHKEVRVTVDQPPPRKGDILIRSTPDSATVFLNSIRLSGTTPIRLDDQPAVLHEAHLLMEGKDDYLPLDTTFVIEADKLNEYDFTLIQKTGSLTITTSPAGAAVIFDNYPRRTTPLRNESMPIGTYVIRIEKTEYDIISSSVTVNYQEETVLRYSLETIATAAWKRRRRISVQLAEVLPGFGQLYSGQSRGLLYSGAFIGAGYLVYDLSTLFLSAKRNFKSAREDYRSATTLEAIELAYAPMVSERETMIKAQEAINLLLPVIGGVYVLQILDALIFGGGKRPVTDASGLSFHYRLEPLVAHEGNSLQFRLGINF